MNTPLKDYFELKVRWSDRFELGIGLTTVGMVIVLLSGLFLAGALSGADLLDFLHRVVGS
jgi:hypothetical protein